MADIFIEHLVAQRITAKSMLIRAAYFLAFLLVNAIVAVVMLPYVLFSLAGGIWLLYILFRQLNVEFEYIMTNGELDIDRITGQSKRKRLLTLDCRNLEICAPMESGSFEPYEHTQFAKKLDVSSGNDSPGRYFIVTHAKEGGRQLIIFEPDDRILAAIRTFGNRGRY